MRLRLVLAIALLAVCGLVSDGRAAPTVVDPPRWRGRISLVAGVGGSNDTVQSVTMHPIRLELGVQIYRQLSFVASVGGVLATTVDDACGTKRAPHAALGGVGLRADLWNGKSSPWPVPFVEGWVGVGGQPRIDRDGAVCERMAPFVTGGGRLGLDTWLGRVAVTVAVSFDYLPRLPTAAFSLAATAILW